MILCGDALEQLKTLPDESVHCCITSPPYYGLRDYGNEAQIGLEDSPEEYIDKLVQVFREVRRVLRNDGTLWVNIGDSYNGSGRGRNANGEVNFSVFSSCREAHFATFPEKLIEPCILAGSPIGGVVLDPFFGSGTTGRVATKFNRDYIGIELNHEYIKIAETRANIVQLSLLGLGDENECG